MKVASKSKINHFDMLSSPIRPVARAQQRERFMSHTRKFSSPPLHPLFQSALPGALSAARDGAPGLIALDPRGGLALGRFRLRPADDRALRVEMADAARLAGVGAVRLPGGAVAIPDLDGMLGRALPFADRQAASRALALARATLLLPAGIAALVRAEGRRRTALAKRVARAIRLAAPAASEALRGLAGQLELACHLHEMQAGVASSLLAILADREALREIARAPLDRSRLRALGRREVAHLADPVDWMARDARLDRVLGDLEAPRAVARWA
jgi:hypothetical protein